MFVLTRYIAQVGAGLRQRWQIAPHVILLILAVVGLVIGSLLAFTPPALEAVAPADLNNFPLTSSIIIQFTKPVNRSELRPEIIPPVVGQWSYHEPAWGNHLYTTLQFTPEEMFSPNTIYTIELAGITNAVGLSRRRTGRLQITTQTLPEVLQVSPSNGAEGILPKDPLRVTFTGPSSDLANYTFTFEPPVEFEAAAEADGESYLVTPKSPLAAGTRYRFIVDRTITLRDPVTGEIELQDEPTLLYDGFFSTIPPLQVAAISPTGTGVALHAPIAITFPEAMKEDTLQSHFSIVPATPANLILQEDGKKLLATPAQALQPGSEYVVRVLPGAETLTGAPLEEEIVFGFQTIGQVGVTHISPATDAKGMNVRSAVRLTFNQAVNQVEAESRVSVEPTFSFQKVWEGNTVILKPTESLKAGTRYTVRVAAGVPGTQGTPPSAAFESHFTTAQQFTKLSVGIDFQDRPLSCEAAALKMALAAKGVKVSETDIMRVVGYDKTPHRNGVWGDPNQAFVGNIDGRQNTTGYGVHWNPIGRAANTWRSSEVFTGWSVSQLAQEIAAGNAIVIWGTTGPAYRETWKTPTGKTITAWKGEHTRTVIGFYGSVDAPTKFIINDPNAGQLIWSRDQLERNWAAFGRAGVVVR